MLSVLSELYLGLGLEDQAVALDKKQVAIAKSLYGSNSSQEASALSDLAESMQDALPQEREAVLLQAKAILDRKRDFKSPERGRLLLDLAELYENTDQQKALESATQAIALYRAAPPSLELAQALYHRGFAYSLSKDYASAVVPLAECVSIAQNIGLKANVSLPQFEALLADVNLRLLRYGPARDNFEAAFNTAKAVYGNDHEITMQTESALAEFFSQTSQYSDALGHLKNALANCLKLRGPADPFNTPQIYLMYGATLAHSGHFEEALAALSQSVENWRKNRPGTRSLADALSWQASVLASLGQYDKARALLEEATAISKTAGSKLLQFDLARVRLEIAFDLKQPDQASAIVMSDYRLPPDRAPLSLDMLRSLLAHARLALLKNDPADALRLATRVLDTVTLNSNRRYLRLWEERALLTQGLARVQMHAAGQALEPLQRAVKLDAEMYDDTSAELIPARAALAAAYFEAGNRAESIKLLAELESVYKIHPHLGDRFEGPLRAVRQSLRGGNPH